MIQARPIGATELEQIRQLLAAHPDWSRRQLSQQLARQWEWRNGVGQLKDMAARSLLVKLEQRGWIVLPPRRRRPCNRLRDKRRPQPPLAQFSPLLTPLAVVVRPLIITEVSTSTDASQRALFESLLHYSHYLSHRSTVGENLQYLVGDSQGHPLACLLFGAAAWQCAQRDHYIGWDPSQRLQNLHLLANNTRFLILPGPQRPQLASWVLSQVSRRLSRDWRAKYGHPIYLLESFVERDRFAGTSYRAANWVRVGQTKGRSRQDRRDGTWHQVPVKDVYLYALHRRFRERLQGQSAQPPTSGHELPG